MLQAAQGQHHVGPALDAGEQGAPLDTRAKVEWRENLALTRNGMEVRERDDFFSTMLLGTQPYATCLSYRGGAYCDCGAVL